MASPIQYTQHDFSGGELPPKKQGRSDSEQYLRSVEKAVNMLPDVEGTIRARPGTSRETSTDIPVSENGRIEPISPSTNESFLLEFSSTGIRIIDSRNIENTQLLSNSAGNTAVVEGAGSASYNGIYTLNPFKTNGLPGTNKKVYEKTSADGTTIHTIETSETDQSVESSDWTDADASTRVITLPATYTRIRLVEYDATTGLFVNQRTRSPVIYEYIGGSRGWLPSIDVSDYSEEAFDNFKFMAGANPQPQVTFYEQLITPTGFAESYASDDIPDLRLTPRADTIYLTHVKYPPGFLYRDAYGSWQYERITFDSQPFVLPTQAEQEIELSLADFTYQVSIYVEGHDFSVYTGTDYISYRQNGEYVLAKFVSTDGDNEHAIVEPVKSIVTGLSKTARIEAVASGAHFEALGAVAEVLVADEAVFTEGLVGSYIRFVDITSTGQATGVKWALIDQYLGLDIAGSGLFFHNFNTKPEVSIVKYDSTFGLKTAAVEFNQVDQIRLTNNSGAALNTTTLTASSALFDLYGDVSLTPSFWGNDIGREIQLVIADTVINCFIQGISSNSTTKARVSVDAPLPYDTDAIPSNEGVASSWKWGAFYPGNYPAANGIYAGRLILGGTPTHPDTVWASETERFFNFSPVERDNTVLATTGFSLELPGARYSKIRWILGHSQLLVGMEGSLWRVRDVNNVFSFSTVIPEKQADVGSKLPPVPLGNSLILVHVSGRRIHEMFYNDNGKTYEIDDGSRIPSHLFEGTDEEIKEINSFQEPEPSIWLIRKDGLTVSITPRFTSRGTSFGTAQHEIGFAPTEETGFLVDEASLALTDETGLELTDISYTGSLVFPEVLSMAPIFNESKGREDLYFLAARGAQVYLERMSFSYKPTSATDKIDMLFLDSSTTESVDTPKTTWTEFSDYEGETVDVVADGVVVQEAYVVPSSGVVTPSASRVTVGFSYVPKLILLPIAPELTRGNVGSLGLQFQLEEAYVRVLNSLDLYAGTKDSEMFQHDFADQDDVLNATNLYTGDVKLLVEENTSRGPQLQIEQRKPYPLQILAITIRGNLHHR